MPFHLPSWVDRANKYRLGKDQAAERMQTRAEMVRGGKSAQSRANSWRTQRLFLLFRIAVLGRCLCEFLISNTIPATHGLAHAASEYEGATLIINVGWGNILVPAWVALCGSASCYDSSQIFNKWIGMLQGPLDAFEQIHICGKEVASIFYDTREDTEEPSVPEDVMTPTAE